MQTLVSIIIPSFNDAHLIRQTFKSVLVQTYANWECIIVDDGSTDNTRSIVKKWVKIDSRFKYLYQVNRGVSASRNNAIKIARGVIILPLDSDDLIEETYLEKIINAFNIDINLKLVYCSANYFGNKDGTYYLPNYNYKKLLVQNCFVNCSAYRKSDWHQIGGYDESLKSFEDWDFWIRLLDNESKTHHINEILFFYRKHQTGSLTSRFKHDSDFYFELYDMIYLKNKSIYDSNFGNPILAFQENIELKAFNEKIKKLWIFKLYVKIIKLL